MKIWHIVAIALAVTVGAMLVIPHIPFVRDLITPKPAK